MKTLTALFFALFVGFAAAPALAEQPGGAAPDPAHVKAAEDLLNAVDIKKQYTAVFPLISGQIVNVIERMKPELKGKVGPVMDSIMQNEFKDNMGELTREIAKLYAKKFSIDDLKEMTRFFNTPVGKRWTQSVPELAKEGMVLGQRWGQQVSKQAMKRLREELRKQGHDI